MRQSSLQHMIQMVERYLTPRPFLRIVEIASQDVKGRLHSLFKKPGRHYTGVDLCEGTNVDLVLDDPYHFPLSSDNIDVMISGSVFEQVEFFWQTLIEMHRVTRLNGMIILVVPSPGPEYRYRADCWRTHWQGYVLSNWSMRTQEGMTAVLQAVNYGAIQSVFFVYRVQVT